MGKKTLTNAHCLLDLIEKAPVSILKIFSGLAECQVLVRGFDWSQNEADLCANLLEHIKHLRKEKRDSAEREALPVMRLTSARGAAILSTVADQLHDSDLQNEFLAQDGGEMGRAIWMRTHSDDTARLFDVAETILNTGDIRGNKRLYDAFDVPCDDEPPPFIWNGTVKNELETQLTKVMRLAEQCELIYVPMIDSDKNGNGKKIHFLVVRFAGDQISAVQMVNRNRKNFFYFPARDATLVYSADRKVVEVYAQTLTTRAPLADVLSKHGFKMPLSNRPLNRSRYDLSPFAHTERCQATDRRSQGRTTISDRGKGLASSRHRCGYLAYRQRCRPARCDRRPLERSSLLRTGGHSRSNVGGRSRTGRREGRNATVDHVG